MYCPECGTKLPKGSLFCPECGHPSLAKVPVYVMKGGIVRVGMPYESKSLRGTKVYFD